MRAFGFWCWLLAISKSVSAATLIAQEPSLLRDLPAVQVMIDWVHVPMTAPAADSLRQRVILQLRAAGVPVTDRKDPVTFGSFLFAPGHPLKEPTFLVSLNMVPDGCAFVTNFYVRMPVAIAGYSQKVPVSVYASRSYIYSTVWRDHSPVLNFLEDFIEAWRSANKR